MSQVFVKKVALSGTDPIVVMAQHPDTPMVSRLLYGDTLTPLALPSTKLTLSDPTTPGSFSHLMSDWRQSMPGMANGEAARRIQEVFPDYMQQNANADINTSTLKYGADPSTWPPDAQDRKAEGDRGWNYVSSVRTASDALSSQTNTVDPTANAHWPTVIAPIYIPPVVS